MGYAYEYTMEYKIPGEFFQTYPQWHTLAPSGPGYENWLDDAGDPIITYTVDLLYPPQDFWFMIRIDHGGIEIGDAFHLALFRDRPNNKITILLDWTLDGEIERQIEFVFPFVFPPFLTHKMCALGVSGDYSLRTYNKVPTYYETSTREGAGQPTLYWFLHMGGAFGYIRPPWFLPQQPNLMEILSIHQ